MAQGEKRSVSERTFSPDAVGRFWAKVGQVPGQQRCWPWKGRFGRNGRPVTKIFWGGRTVSTTPRQAAFTFHHGRSPIGAVRHRGPEPEGVYCCNPEHLYDTKDVRFSWAGSLENFMTRVRAENGYGMETMCWTWLGRVADEKPVGQIRNPRGSGTLTLQARRVAYELYHGRKPHRHETVVALCANDRCVAPAHLGTRKYRPSDSTRKLTNEQVRQLRLDAIETGVPRGWIKRKAEEYRVSPSTIVRTIDHERRSHGSD